MMHLSVVTLVQGRTHHLHRVIHGLHRSHRPPDELVIAYMNQPDHPPLPPVSFPIRSLDVHSPHTAIPLASARNAAAAAAHGDVLLFLDVDCIPHPDLLSHVVAALHACDGLVMGTIRYLRANAVPDEWPWDDLERNSVRHPTRPLIPSNEDWMRSERYELFWTLCFGMYRHQFAHVGGFDERYYGYGAEDTDFAFRARQQGIPFIISAGTCYHQHHAVYKPPLQHLADIVRNAQRFRNVWNTWPMTGWLTAFAERGFIHWQPDQNRIEIVRMPTDAEIAAARVDSPAGF